MWLNAYGCLSSKLDELEEDVSPLEQGDGAGKQVQDIELHPRCWVCPEEVVEVVSESLPLCSELRRVRLQADRRQRGGRRHHDVRRALPS